MNPIVFLYVACILAGFALLDLPSLSFISSLVTFFDIVGVIAIIVFSFALLYLGVKSLIKK
ncbi:MULTISPECIES: hypothetical protein [unclassified Bacillus (in: firmicutes)]|uniref:hypothetical protein n=1 Tax=unclassified Bacillus (in: firmicutes) TaxID=185979 RepID=UPI0008ECB141|nr:MULTISPECIES: hypothetical protein [unclassified Bacillus (in: firmicutes)]SFA80409.1 hypothetical protein SAMN02799634_101936 [Bacillus sp. UNCCL13]SFQ70468.1 hypothetical protein SAMN04488577_1211 [Bacillus sp. cl95]